MTTILSSSRSHVPGPSDYFEKSIFLELFYALANILHFRNFKNVSVIQSFISMKDSTEKRV